MTELFSLASAGNGDGKFRSMSIILRGVSDQIAEELSDMDPDSFAQMMAQIGLIVEWVGTGDKTILTEGLRIFAEKIEPSTPGTEDDIEVVEAELVEIEQ